MAAVPSREGDPRAAPATVPTGTPLAAAIARGVRSSKKRCQIVSSYTGSSASTAAIRRCATSLRASTEAWCSPASARDVAQGRRGSQPPIDASCRGQCSIAASQVC